MTSIILMYLLGILIVAIQCIACLSTFYCAYKLFSVLSKKFSPENLPWEKDFTKKDKVTIFVSLFIPLVVWPIVSSLPSRSDVSNVVFILASELPEEKRAIVIPLLGRKLHECPRVK